MGTQAINESTGRISGGLNAILCHEDKEQLNRIEKLLEQIAQKI